MVFLGQLVAAYLVGHALYFAVPDDILRDTVIHRAVVVPSVAVVALVAPHEEARAAGHVLVSPRFALEVVRGCDGFGVALLLASAIVAFAAPWRRKLAGLALGLVLVYAANLARIVVLYFVVAHRSEWFAPLHGYLVPITLVALVALYFTRWVARCARPLAARGAAA